MAKILLLTFACFTGVSLTLAGGGWSYDRNAADGPSNWGGYCNGSSQSPIAINTTATTYSAYGAFSLLNYNTKPAVNFTGTNNGHSLKVSFPALVYNVSGGGLTGTYTTVQFHLHWGSTNTQGSEHTLDGTQFPAEIHFVSYNTKYNNISTALGNADGLAVLGAFLKVGQTTNAQYEKFMSYTSQLQNKSSEVSNIASFELDQLLPADKSKFYRYSGSLTNPDCNEVVTWTVFSDAVEISQAQLNALRTLKMNNSMNVVDNYRPVQPVGNRNVKRSFQIITGTASVPTEPNEGIALKISNAVLLLMLFSALSCAR